MIPRKPFPSPRPACTSKRGCGAPYNNDRLMTYDEMLGRTKNSYKDFLKAEEKRNTLVKLLEKIASGDYALSNTEDTAD